MIQKKKFLLLCILYLSFPTEIIADHNPICAKVVFYSSKETLRRILQTISNRQKGAYLRFGQTDVHIASTPNASLPADVQNLQGEVRESFRISTPSSFRALPYPCKGANIAKIPLEQIPQSCKQLIQKTTPYWGSIIGNLYDRDALMALAQNPLDMHYAIRFLKRLKGMPNIVFIGNETTPPHIRHCLFGSSCKFISVSPTEAHKELDRIEQECLKNIQDNKYTVVVFSAGFAGRIIAKRLWNKRNNIFLFDLGGIVNAISSQDSNYSIDYDKFLAMISRDTNILYTAAVINFQFDFRKNEYMRCLNLLHDYWYEPYIVEACSKAPTFLEQHCKNVYYSQVNNASLKNKGTNEAKSMIQALNHYNFNDNDLIIKLTGRYYFKSDSFLRLVEATPDIDGYVTLDPRTFFSFTGCYGLRCKYFKEMLNSIDLNRMEREMIDVEHIVIDYMRKIEKERGAKIMYLDEVDVKSLVAHYLDYDW